VRKVVVGLLSAVLASGVGFSLPTVAVAAPPVVPPDAVPSGKAAKPASDETSNPFEAERRALRQQAVANVVSGRAKVEKRGASSVVNMGKVNVTGAAGAAGLTRAAAGKDQYVEVGREKTDKLFVILAEFGNERHPDYPDYDVNPATAGPVVYDGPAHNKIPQPDRTVDNVTNWNANYSADYFRKMYFGAGKNVESLKTYFETQSSGRYSVNGKVSDWVKVKYNEARYGRSSDVPSDANGDDPKVCDDHVCSNSEQLVKDAANQWVAEQKNAGRTDAQIATDLKAFDVYDRYDFDADGNFNEPDGYLDHFQIVHAGGDEADGDRQQGEDAIWSHRGYAFGTDEGITGPATNKRGGSQVGTTGLWIGDYTMQPENGGLSVFTHEFAHDLGLPDDYDTSGLGSNNNVYWTLMSQSRLGAKGDPALGMHPGDLGAWNKLQLGWLDYETVVAGKTKTLNLGPQEYNSAKAQGVVVVLPKKRVTTEYGVPYAGAKQYFSGNRNDFTSLMTREFDLTGKSTAALSLKGRYSIEADYDYLYLQASTDAGHTWTAIDGTVNGAPFGRDASGTPAITGSSAGAWVDIAASLDAFAGHQTQFRFRYRTDLAVSEGGFYADDIVVTADGAELLRDGAEGASSWTLKGFTTVGTRATNDYDNFYIAGNRSYASYDRYLKTGPYNFMDPAKKPKWVEHYPYQEGLLVSYWDTSELENNTNVHPGSGLNLYVDSRPAPSYNLAGRPWNVYVQLYDAPFSLKKADSFTLHVNGLASYVRGQDAVPTFDDTQQFLYPEIAPWGVKLPAVGVKIQVLEQAGTSMTVKVS
jgi:immune inhibitor A